MELTIFQAGFELTDVQQLCVLGLKGIGPAPHYHVGHLDDCFPSCLVVFFMCLHFKTLVDYLDHTTV